MRSQILGAFHVKSRASGQLPGMTTRRIARVVSNPSSWSCSWTIWEPMTHRGPPYADGAEPRSDEGEPGLDAVEPALSRGGRASTVGEPELARGEPGCTEGEPGTTLGDP